MAVLTERKIWRRSDAELPMQLRVNPNRLRDREIAFIRATLEVLRIRCGSWRQVAITMKIHRGRISRVY